MDRVQPAARGLSITQSASGPWTDLGLTLPIFVAYHLGVVWLPVRNGADWLTLRLIDLADHDLFLYGLLTLTIGACYAGVLWVAGRGQALRTSAFVWLMLEAISYAIAMRMVAGYVVGKMAMSTATFDLSAGSGFILSLGAGFYEEVAFRVGLFGLGYRAITVLFPLNAFQRGVTALGWAVVAAMLFSLWHYVGPFGEPLQLQSFVFRWVCGLVFTLIYVLRGFAPAVWTHALYDVWVLAF